MAQTLTITKYTSADRNAMCWLAGNPAAVPPHTKTLIGLRAVDAVNYLQPIPATKDDPGAGAGFSLTDKGWDEAAKGLPAKRAPRKPKAGKGTSK